MRHFSILFLALVLSFSASAVQVTLNCDARNITVSADGMRLAGDLQMAAGLGSNWTPNTGGTLNQLTDPDGDKVYTITFDIPAGTYNYKFLKGFGDSDWESVPSACESGGNRPLVVGAMPITQSFCFGSCDAACPTVIPVTVKLRVNMSNETVSPNGVHVAGAFQGWSPSATELLDPDGDKIYEADVVMNNGTYGYKFVNGNDWPGGEGIPCDCVVGNDRSITVPFTTDIVVAPVICFSSCTNSCPSSDLTITFKVDMFNELLNPTGVFVAGDWQTPSTWKKNVNQMTDANNDLIYEYTATGVKRTQLDYKFFNGNYALATDTTDSDIYSETKNSSYIFKNNGCGICGNFNNRQFNAATTTGAVVLPTYVYGKCDIVSSVHDLTTAGNIKIAGNPMSIRSYLQFNNKNNDNHHVNIVDVTGKVVRTYASFNGSELMIERGNLVSGIYFVQLLNEKGEGATVKLSVL